MKTLEIFTAFVLLIARLPKAMYLTNESCWENTETMFILYIKSILSFPSQDGEKERQEFDIFIAAIPGPKQTSISPAPNPAPRLRSATLRTQEPSLPTVQTGPFT